MLFWEGRWVGVVLGMGLCKATIYMWLNNSHRRYCFVAAYPLAVRDCLFTWVSVHDSVIDFPHQLFHSWPRERSSAIRNPRPARLAKSRRGRGEVLCSHGVRLVEHVKYTVAESGNSLVVSSIFALVWRSSRWLSASCSRLWSLWRHLLNWHPPFDVQDLVMWPLWRQVMHNRCLFTYLHFSVGEAPLNSLQSLTACCPPEIGQFLRRPCWFPRSWSMLVWSNRRLGSFPSTSTVVHTTLAYSVNQALKSTIMVGKGLIIAAWLAHFTYLLIGSLATRSFICVGFHKCSSAVADGKMAVSGWWKQFQAGKLPPSFKTLPMMPPRRKREYP